MLNFMRKIMQALLIHCYMQTNIPNKQKTITNQSKKKPKDQANWQTKSHSLVLLTHLIQVHVHNYTGYTSYTRNTYYLPSAVVRYLHFPYSQMLSGFYRYLVYFSTVNLLQNLHLSTHNAVWRCSFIHSHWTNRLVLPEVPRQPLTN